MIVFNQTHHYRVDAGIIGFMKVYLDFKDKDVYKSKYGEKIKVKLESNKLVIEDLTEQNLELELLADVIKYHEQKNVFMDSTNNGMYYDLDKAKFEIYKTNSTTNKYKCMNFPFQTPVEGAFEFKIDELEKLYPQD